MRFLIPLAAIVLVSTYPDTPASAAKLTHAECRAKVMENPTYLDGKFRRCGRQCNAAIARCVQTGGKFN